MLSGRHRSQWFVIVGLQEEIRVLKAALPAVGVNSEIDGMIQMEKVVHEVAERERRKTNLMLFGISEGSASGGDVDDVGAVREMLSAVGVDTDGLKTTRLGKIDPSRVGYARPLKVQLASESAVVAAVRSASKLRQTWPGITVARDQTPAQNHLYKLIRAQLNARVEAGEGNLRIKYMDGIPTIVSEN